MQEINIAMGTTQNVSHQPIHVQRNGSGDQLYMNNDQNLAINAPNIEQHSGIEIQNQVLNPQNPQPNIIINENRENPEDVQKKLLIEYGLNLLLSHIFGALILCKFLYNMPYGFIFLVLFIQITYDVYLVVPKISSQKSYLIFLVEKVLLFISEVMVFLYLSTYSFCLSLIVMPIGGIFILRSIKYTMDKNLKDCQTIVDFFAIGYKLYLLIQSATISFKIDNVVDWSWIEVFWPYWVLFSILIGINFGMLFMFISKGFQILWDIFGIVQGIFWMETVCLSFTLISSFLIINLCGHLDGENKRSNLILVLYAIIVSFILNVWILFYWRKNLIEFLIKSAEEERLNNSVSQEIEVSHEPNSLITIKAVIPKFLTKFSSTYFKKAEINSALFKQNVSKKKKNKEKLNPFVDRKSQTFSNFNSRISTNQLKKCIKQAKSSKDKKEIIKKKFDLLKNNNLKKEPSPCPSLLNLELNENNENYIPNQILTPPIRKFEKLMPKILENDEKFVEKMSNTWKKSRISPLNISIEEIKFDKDEEKIFPSSAADLPITRQLSGFIDKSKLKSNQDLAAVRMKQRTESNINGNCFVCFDKPPNAVFMNCGHGGICYECAKEIFSSSKECYLCRTKINQVLEIDIKVIAGDYFQVIQGMKLQSFIEK